MSPTVVTPDVRLGRGPGSPTRHSAMPDEPHRIEGVRPSSALVVALEHAAHVELNWALADFASSKDAAFYVHAGAALELEVKAALARLNPLLILDPRARAGIVTPNGFSPALR